MIQGNEVMSYYDLDKSYYAFDHTLGPECEQEEVYELAVSQSISDVFSGVNSTVMAYGQTGAGKSYTMMGPGTTVDKEGAIPRACAHIFGWAEHLEAKGISVKVSCSCLQIYQESVQDMLDPSKTLKVRETPERGVWIDNLTVVSASTQDQLLSHVRNTEKLRHTGCTDMSERSSRSHSVYMFTVTQEMLDGSSLSGKLCLVDLAGSEKVTKSGVTNQALIEAKNINKSLSALGNCIQALVNKATSSHRKKIHVPYRDSKLTHILQDSLGGKARQTLVVACSQHWSSYEETISSLRFATRAKLVSSTPKSNTVDAQSRMGQELSGLSTTATQLEDHLEKQDRRDPAALNLIGSIRARCATIAKLEKQRGPGEQDNAAEKSKQGKASKGELMESEARCQMLLQKMSEQEEELQRAEAEISRSAQIEEEAHKSVTEMQVPSDSFSPFPTSLTSSLPHFLTHSLITPHRTKSSSSSRRLNMERRRGTPRQLSSVACVRSSGSGVTRRGVKRRQPTGTKTHMEGTQHTRVSPLGESPAPLIKALSSRWR